MPYPEISELKIISKSLYNYKPDIVIAIGGGSVIDYSKICNVINLKDDPQKQIFSKKLTFFKETLN